MAEIKYPAKRTFWKTTGTVHEGFTDIDQVTTTGQLSLVSNVDATTIFPALPASGLLKAGEIYSYNGGMVQVVQDHERTIYKPEDTPALFSIYRANSNNLQWIVGEKVEKGDTRIYNGKTYRCIQAHQSQETWNPELTLGTLWQVVVTTSEWAAGVAYKVNDIVTYGGSTYKCLQAHTSISTWYPSAVPALWQKQ